MKKQLTEFKRAHKLHKRLWTWLSRNPDKRKEDWPGWRRVYKDKLDTAMVRKASNDDYNSCFACAVVDLICSQCPLFGGTVGCAPCVASSSPFTKWCTSSLSERRAKYALALANMPWINHAAAQEDKT